MGGIEIKKRRLENPDQQVAAQTLLELSNSGITYCEPQNATYTMTELSMADIEVLLAKQYELETKIDGLKRENEHLKEECLSLKERVKQTRSCLLQDHVVLKTIV